jgi:thiamine biosynthesis lipoprotein
MGVSNQITVGGRAALPEALAIARREVQAIDDACSRFRDDSELARLNRAAGRTMQVSSLLAEALKAALAAAAATGGLVDPTVGATMRALGYDRDFELVLRRERGAFSVVPARGWSSIRLDTRHNTVRVPAGVELDLGAISKALAADRIAAAVNDAIGSDVLVALGGDIAVAGAPARGWPVRVTDDHRRPSGDGQTVSVTDGGLATSSTAVRRWRSGGIDMHHIVDPRTGVPVASCWRTVSVAAASCVEANAAATAAIVKGEDALGWLERAALPARLVRLDGSVARTSAWPEVTP